MAELDWYHDFEKPDDPIVTYPEPELPPVVVLPPAEDDDDFDQPSTRAAPVETEPTERSFTTARVGDLIGIPYGRISIPGKIARARAYNDKLLLLVVWCEGPVDAVERVYTDEGDLTPVASYTGHASQTGDGTILAAFGQADDLPGICYSVLLLEPDTSVSGIRAVIRGRPVITHRAADRLYLADDLTGWTLSDVAAISITHDAVHTSTLTDTSTTIGAWASYGVSVGGGYSEYEVNYIVKRDPNGGVCKLQLRFSDDPASPFGNGAVVQLGLDTGRLLITADVEGVATAKCQLTTVGSADYWDVRIRSQNPGKQYVVPVILPCSQTEDNFGQGNDLTLTGSIDVYEVRVFEAVYSKNPAFVLADFIHRFTDYVVHWTSFGAAADYCDESITGLVPRWEIGMLLEDRRKPSEWIQTLLEYANLYGYVDSGAFKVVPDEPGTPSISLDGSDIIEDSLRINKLSQRSAPTQVISTYTFEDSNNVWSREEVRTPDPSYGDPLLVAKLTLVGYQRAIHAYRKSMLVLNRATVEDLEVAFDTFDVGVKITVGDLVSITHPFGLSGHVFRITFAQSLGGGKYRFRGREYSALSYSEDAVDDPGDSDTNLPDPTAVPDGPDVATNSLAATEILWEDEGGKWYSVFKITWNGLSWPFMAGYRVQVLKEGNSFFEAYVPHYGGGLQHEALTPPSQQDVSYTIKIWAVSSTNLQSTNPGVLDNVIGNGKSLIPTSVVQSSMTGLEFGQIVWLSHDAVGDTDLRGYRWKRLAEVDYNGAGSDAARWGHANAIQLVDRHDSTQVLFANQPEGTWFYGVRGVDSVGQESSTSAWYRIIVTADQAASVSVLNGAFYTATSGGSWDMLNMHVYERFGEARVATSHRDTDSLIDRFGATSSQWPADQTEPFNYGFTFASYIRNTSVQFSTTQDVAGTFSHSAVFTSQGGASVTRKIHIATLAGYPTFTTYPGDAVQAEANRVFGSYEVASALNAGMTVYEPIRIGFQGKPQSEELTINVPASPQPHAFSWSNSYAGKPEYSFRVEGTSPVIVAFDGVDADGGQVRCWNTSGAPVAATVIVTAQGV